MKRLLPGVLTLIVLLSLSGCGEAIGIRIALSEKQRVTSPDVDAPDLELAARVDGTEGKRVSGQRLHRPPFTVQ